MIKRLFNNRILGFIFTKYAAFGIQLVNSIFIAKYLGLYYFGLFGFALMILQYSSYLNMGIPYSYSVLCADAASAKDGLRKKITGVSISLLLIVSVSIFLIYLGTFPFDIFPKYQFGEYYFIVVAIAIFQQFNNLFVCIFRIYGKIREINWYFLFIPLFQFGVTLFYKESDLFYALLYATLGANILSCLLFIVFLPAPLKGIKIPDFSMSSSILRRGIFLLFCNLTFYGIILSSRSIVSNFYSVDEFALFNFSNSISSAVFLLLGSLSFLFYPKLINIISTKTDNRELIGFIEKIRKFYLSLTLLIVFCSLLTLPILFFFLPQYTEALPTLQLLLLAQLFINNSFGYSTLLMQKGKEIQMTWIAVLAITIIIVLSLTGIHFFQTSMEFVAITVICAVLVYNFLIVYAGNKITRQFSGNLEIIKELYKFSLFGPIILYIALSIFNSEYYYLNTSISLSAYIILNFNSLKQVMTDGIKMFLGKNDLLNIS